MAGKGASESGLTDVYLGVPKDEPVEVGQELEVKIEKLLASGRGEASLKDRHGHPYLIFIDGKGLRVGQKVKVSITELMGGFANAIAHSGNW
jgi:predicted RNA-binding protein with TRAM domain